MSEQSTNYSGGCMCGRVRFEIYGEPNWVGHCHCSSCRRHSGASVSTYVGFESDQVRFESENRKIYESSPGVYRSFCPDCGSTLTWEGSWPEMGDLIEIHIGALDNPELFKPVNHMMYAERIPWFDVADNLPRFAGDNTPGTNSPVAHGPSDEVIGDSV